MRLSVYSIVFLMLFSGCKKNYDEMLASSLKQQNYIPVHVVEIESSTDHIPIYSIGRVASDRETKLSFKTGGYIASINVREGDYVRQGKLLGRLRTQEIDAQVLKAQRALEKTERDLTRVNDMYRDSVATLENVQDLTTMVEISRADLEIAKYNQAFSKIISPVSGRVLRRLSEPSELVSPGQPILVIGSSGAQSYIMTVHVSDKDIAMIDYGAKAIILFDAYPDINFAARVKRISESADPMTGTFEVELDISSHTKRLRNGLIGRVTLFPSQQNEYIKIPMTSISEGEAQRITVYIPSESDTIAEKVQLQVERFADDFIWVKKENFKHGRIITLGSAYLRDGQQIRIQNK